MDTTALLQKSVGNIGRWQVMLVVLIFLSKFSVAWHQLLMVAQQPLPVFKCTDPDIEDPCSVECPGHDFDTTFFKSTVITEWDLVCDKKWVASFIQMMVMLGILVGNVVLGWASDRLLKKYTSLK